MSAKRQREFGELDGEVEGEREAPIKKRMVEIPSTKRFSHSQGRISMVMETTAEESRVASLNTFATKRATKSHDGSDGWIDVRIADVRIKMKIDSGACANIITVSAFNKILRESKPGAI